ncbi:MAG: hypothetical protein ABEJ07_04675 [Candidatus Nanohaloarchaea archaeon]
MINEEIRERLLEVSIEADLELKGYGLDQDMMPEIRYSTIIGDTNTAKYDPVSDAIYVSLDPGQVSEVGREEIRTEIMSELLIAYSVDREELLEEREEYRELQSLYESAKEPLEILLNHIEDVYSETYGVPRTHFGTPESVEFHVDKIREGDRIRLRDLRGRFTNLHAWAEEAGQDAEGHPLIGEEDVDFYLDVLDENFDTLQAALDAKREKEKKLERTVRNGRDAVNDKVNQAASRIMPLDRHGNLGSITGEERERFLDNTEVDEDVEELIEEILLGIEIAEDEDPSEALKSELRSHKSDY